ncbi:hypothetical protein [Chondrinema litorale]|uniref:hypothetical protein n=1 Tax=Chondrinema litorale TaxID=2994555 RepID=UPI002543BB0A|nr:hypothetical protein [Chondrinema litorale]UZR93025.1 hypothetical protein OQ292_14280 [Chondrinema litorale]
MAFVYIILGIIVVFVALTFWKKYTRSKDIITVENPKILIASLEGDQEDLQLAKEDQNIYSSTFKKIDNKIIDNTDELLSLAESSFYDVIHLIVNVEEGKLRDKNNNSIELRDLIIKAQNGKTTYVLLAKGNDHTNYMEGMEGESFAVNLVMTVDRKGKDFITFFKSLFEKINSGKPMPIAWHELAPQIPNANHEHVPGTLCAMGAGNVILREIDS